MNRPAYSALPTIAPSTPLPVKRRDCTQIVEARDATGGDHRNIGALGDGAQQVEVRSGQRAVFGDVGDDEPRTTFAVKAFQHFPQVSAVGLPAAAAQPVITVDDLHVQTYRDFVAVVGDRSGHTTCGFSSAAVPRLTPRAQPVASAADSDSSSRIPPDSSTCASSLPTTSASSSRLEPRPNAASKIDQVHPFGAVALPVQCAASSAVPYSVSLPALPCTKRTARPSTTSTAGNKISGTS